MLRGLMHDSHSPFSSRHGYRGPEAEITVREDAPEILRQGVVMLGRPWGEDTLSQSEVRAGLALLELLRPRTRELLGAQAREVAPEHPDPWAWLDSPERLWEGLDRT